jgi:hypothetical protein
MNSVSITKLAQYYLLVLATVCLIDTPLSFIYAEEMAQVDWDNPGPLASLIGWFQIILFMGSYFVVGRWLYVSSTINHSMGKKDLTVSPGWSVGWYFIPIANLFRPYVSMKETYQASFKGGNWKNQSVPVDLPIWWATWLGWGGINFFSAVTHAGVEPGETLEQGMVDLMPYTDFVVNILLIVNVIFLLRIMRTISENHNGASAK